MPPQLSVFLVWLLHNLRAAAGLAPEPSAAIVLIGRDGVTVARCTVERLVRRMGFHGAARGKETRTTIADKASLCPADEVNRHFRASRPNIPWVSDFTYLAT